MPRGYVEKPDRLKQRRDPFDDPHRYERDCEKWRRHQEDLDRHEETAAWDRGEKKGWEFDEF